MCVLVYTLQVATMLAVTGAWQSSVWCGCGAVLVHVCVELCWCMCVFVALSLHNASFNYVSSLTALLSVCAHFPAECLLPLHVQGRRAQHIHGWLLPSGLWAVHRHAFPRQEHAHPTGV